MFDHTFSKLANHQIRNQATHKVGCHLGDLHMVNLIFLRGLCGYVWVKILTLSIPRYSSIPSAEIIPPSILWLCSQADSQVALRRRVGIHIKAASYLVLPFPFSLNSK